MQSETRETVLGAANAAVAATVWRHVADALEQSGFGTVGPEYSRLSELLVASRASQVEGGASEDDDWVLLQEHARRALNLLEPLFTAARRIVAADGLVAVGRPTAEEGTPTAQSGATRPSAAAGNGARGAKKTPRTQMTGTRSG